MNLLDYLETEFDTFAQKPLNEIDAAVFTQLCMIRIELPLCAAGTHTLDDQGVLHQARTDNANLHVHLHELLRAEHYAEMFTGLAAPSVKECLSACAASPRFRDVTITSYQTVFQEDPAVQFSATTFVTPQFAFVAFRGTDSTYTGWREDFDLAYKNLIPAQALACEYVNRAAAEIPPEAPLAFYIGGHSKGGNLAEYVALAASDALLARTETAYSFDGPGFMENAFTGEQFARIASTFCKFVPQDSVIGMILDSSSAFTVVHSKEIAVMQHDLFSWLIEDGRFRRQTGLTAASEAVNNATQEWVHSYSAQEMEEFTDAIFCAINASGALSFGEFCSGGLHTLEFLRKAAQSVQGEQEKIIRRFAADLAGKLGVSAAAQIGEAIKDAGETIKNAGGAIKEAGSTLKEAGETIREVGKDAGGALRGAGSDLAAKASLPKP